MQVVLKGGWRNEIGYRMIPELNMPIMRTWNETVPIYFLHHHYKRPLRRRVRPLLYLHPALHAVHAMDLRMCLYHITRAFGRWTLFWTYVTAEYDHT